MSPIIPLTTLLLSLAWERAASRRQWSVLICREEISAPHLASSPHRHQPASIHHPSSWPFKFSLLQLSIKHTNTPTQTKAQCHYKLTEKMSRRRKTGVKMSLECKAKAKHFFPPFCSGVGALWVSVLIQPLWSMEPLIWTKIREFDPLFLKRWHTGVVFMVIKNHFD